MANQITINIGAAANDGTGDPLRTAFNDVNLNFANVWNTGLPSSNVQFSDNRILTVNTNANLVLAPNGIGKVASNVDIVPNTANAFNLGSLTRRWNTIYTQYIDVGGDLSVGGNLIVTGNIIEMGNIVTDAKTIQLANTANTTTAANGSGITVGANDAIATFLFNSTNNAWATNIGLNVTGNIIPLANVTYSLGNATNWWSNVWVAGNTMYIGGVPVGMGAGNVLTVNGNAVLQNDSNTTISTTGNITADYFFGNGSQLTGINASSNKIFNGNSFANIATANGNAVVSSAGQNWTFDTTGVLTLPLQVYAASNQIKYGMGNLIAWNDGGWTIGEYNGNITGSEGIRINPDIEGPVDITLPATQLANTTPTSISNFLGNVVINSGSNYVSHQWKFGDTGILTLPDGTDIGAVEGANTFGFYNSNANTELLIELGPDNVWSFNGATGTLNLPGGSKLVPTGTNIDLIAGNGGWAELQSFNGNSYVWVDDTGAFIGTNWNATPQQWSFSNGGDLTAPGNIITPTNFVGTSLRTNLTDFNWSDPIVGITLGANTFVQLANNVFGDPWSGQVNISGVSGTSEANGIWYYVATDSNEFELRTNGGADPVDSTSWGAYTSGGIAYTLGYNNLEINGQNITIRSDHGDYNNKIWRFNSNGSTVFPYMDTPRGDNPSGNITGYTLRMGDGTAEAIITTPDGDPTGGQSSQRLVINPGKGADGTAGEGGDIYLWAGRGGDGSGSGGDIKIRGGQGGANTTGGSGGAGGYIRIEAGDANAVGGAAGYIDITGGFSNVAGGYVHIQGGGGNAGGGDANITGGYGYGGPGGNVNIIGGSSAQGAGSYGNVIINTGNTGNTWTFDQYGILTVPGEGRIRSNYDTVILESYDGNISYGLRVGTNGGVFLEQGNTPAWLSIYPNSGNAEIYSGPGGVGEAGKNLTIFAGLADQSTYNTSPGGNLNLEGGIGASNDGGGGGPGGSVNITSGASADPAGRNGNVTINTGGANTWTFDYTGNVSVPGSIVTASGSGGNISGANVITANVFSASGNITGNYFIGNGSLLTGISASYSNSNVATFLAAYGSNTVSTTGNITGGNLIASANVLGSGYARFAGTFDESQASTAGLYLGYAGGTPRMMFGTGNTSQTFEIDNDGGNLRFYQPGSTKATLTPTGNWSVAGNVTGSNITTAGQVSATGNVYTGSSSTTGLILGNVNSKIGILNSNATITMSQNIALNPDTSASSLAGIQIGGNGYLLAANGARVLTLGTNGSATVNGNINQTLPGYQISTAGNIVAAGFMSSVGNVTGGNLLTGGSISATANITVGGRVVVGNGSASVPSFSFTSDGAVDTGFYWVSDGNIGVTNNGVQTAQFLPSGVFKQIPTTVGSLPSASSVGAGARAFCTDLNSTTFGNLAVGGGGTYMPVFSNGTNWYIG